ncbi:MAG: oligogalacturonate-specific porin KdgM family protein [Moraxellaceae bacterium]|nr:outer membrane beta-barrel protein [Moraxellaceae bacterium]MDZ4387899.1 oligogalacturonate-specific porin KdgM family protein [Moraxellaceae bacterium]
MKTKLTLLAAVVALAPMSAMAGGSVDVFFIHNKAELKQGGNSVKEDGNGYGFRGIAELGNGLSLTASHQDTRIKGSNIGTNLGIAETRVGLSYKHQVNDQFSMTGNADFVQLDAELDKNLGIGLALDGYAVGVGASFAVIDNLKVYGNLGYLNLGKLNNKTVDGFEYTVGASYDINQNIAGFIEYRLVDVDTTALGPKVSVDLDTWRIGARYTF